MFFTVRPVFLGFTVLSYFFGWIPVKVTTSQVLGTRQASRFHLSKSYGFLLIVQSMDLIMEILPQSIENFSPNWSYFDISRSGRPG